MAVNKYFARNQEDNTQDQKVMQDLTTELIQNTGFDLEYIPRSYVNRDQLFGEDQSSAFKDAYVIEFRVDPLDQWGGNSDLLNRFGIVDEDSCTIHLSKPRFAEEITSNDADIVEPREGDLVRFVSADAFDQDQRLYEISFVQPEGQFYQYGKLYSYEINIRQFEYGGEEFEGNEDLEQYERDYANKTEMTVTNVDGDLLPDTVLTNVDQSITARVASYDDTTKTLALYHINGIELLKPGITLASADNKDSIQIDNITTNTSGTWADNDYLEQSEDNVLNKFSRNDPFGEY